MKITLQPDRCHIIPQESLHGVHCFSSFDRIIKTMIESKQLFLDEGEYVAGVQIEPTGLSFNIKKFGE